MLKRIKILFIGLFMMILAIGNSYTVYADNTLNLYMDDKSELQLASAKSGKGIQASDGRWWYRHDDGSYTTNGWEYIKNQWYYFDSEGWMVTGKINLNGTIFGFNSNGELYYTRLAVPRISQNKTNWCWAASSLMVGKYINPSSKKTQSNIVSYVKGSIVNDGGSDYEIERAIEFVCSADAIANYSNLSANNCEDKLMNYKPIVMHMSWFGKDMGHAITCFEYDRDNNHTFSFHDPWGNTNDYSVRYRDLVTSANLPTGNGKCTSMVWLR